MAKLVDRTIVTFLKLVVIALAGFIVWLVWTGSRGDGPNRATAASDGSIERFPVAAERAAADNTSNAQRKQVPQQRFKAEPCGEEDQACLRRWYAEYKPAILDELAYWRRFEAVSDMDAATAALREAMEGAAYKHNSWDIFKRTHIDGIDDLELEAITWDCRVSITNIKFWLIAVSNEHSPADIAKQRQEYEESWSACKRQLKL